MCRGLDILEKIHNKKAGHLVSIPLLRAPLKAYFCRIATSARRVYSKPIEDLCIYNHSRHSLLQCLDRNVLNLADSKEPRTMRNKRCLLYCKVGFWG